MAFRRFKRHVAARVLVSGRKKSKKLRGEANSELDHIREKNPDNLLAPDKVTLKNYFRAVGLFRKASRKRWKSKVWASRIAGKKK